MKRSQYYDMRLPERGAREGEANDPADIEDLTYDLGLIDTELERQRVEDVNLEKNKAGRAELLQHTGNTANPHKVTKDQVGLGNVPNVTTNDQTPAYTAAGAPAALVSGEKLSAAFGKIAAAVAALIAHLADGVKHITAAERAAWNKVTEKLPLAGGTLTGFLTLHAAPTEAMHAATKRYVDDMAAQAGSGDMCKSVYDADGDGVVDGAASAQKLAAARKINGTAFDGTSDITTANWGAGRTLTIGNTGKSVNGSANVSWSKSEIGAATGWELSNTAPAAAGWVRIATTSASIGINGGIFVVSATKGDLHSVSIFETGTCYVVAGGTSISQIAHYPCAQIEITKARIVYAPTWSNNYAYVEVYANSASATVSVKFYGHGWKPVASFTAGSIPSGYSNKELTFVAGGVRADYATSAACLPTGISGALQNIVSGGDAQTGYYWFMDSTDPGGNARAKKYYAAVFADHATSAASADSAVDQTARTAANNAMPKAGGTFTGNVAAYSTNRNNACLRNIYIQNGSWENQSTNSILMVRK